MLRFALLSHLIIRLLNHDLIGNTIETIADILIHPVRAKSHKHLGIVATDERSE